jgi:hypothetical protein
VEASCRAVGLAFLAVLAISACGSSASHPSGASTSANGATASGEVSKSPQRILEDAAAALRRARGYELRGTISQHNLSQRIIVVADSSKALDITTSFGEAADQLIVLPTGDYVRGNRDYWLSSLGPRAVVLADHWIQFPVARARTLEALGALGPATVARCLVEDHGTLRIIGDATVEGQRAILIKDAGNVPGSQPGVLAVAASGTPYPLQLTALGPQLAGGRVDVCNDGKATSTISNLYLSHFGHVPAITPPANPIKGPSVPNS